MYLFELHEYVIKCCRSCTTHGVQYNFLLCHSIPVRIISLNITIISNTCFLLNWFCGSATSKYIFFEDYPKITSLYLGVYYWFSYNCFAVLIYFRLSFTSNLCNRSLFSLVTFSSPLAFPSQLPLGSLSCALISFSPASLKEISLTKHHMAS